MVAQRLPYDVIAIIIAELKKLLEAELRAKRQYLHASLAPYASICKSWNTAIERETFQSLSLSKESIGYAETTLNKNPARRSAVKQISFLISYCGSKGRRWDLSKRQLTERDAAFSENLLRFFRFLESMEKGDSHAQKAQNLTLKLNITLHPLTPEDENGQTLKFPDCGYFFDQERAATTYWFDDLRDRGLRCEQAHLRYVKEALPTVHCIKRFILPPNVQVSVWPSVITTMLSVMDGLEHCSIAFDDRRTENPSLRMEYRNALGETLREIPPTCEYFHGDFQNQSKSMKEQPRPDPGSPDILSIGIRDLSTRLVDLSLDSLAISSSLFWPDTGNESAVVPYWPRLKRVYVKNVPTLAVGPQLVCTNESQIESRPQQLVYTEASQDLERTNGFFLAVGKATRNMPALQEMELETSERQSSGFWFIYKYDEKRRAFVVTWGSYPRVFEVSADVLEAFGIVQGGFVDRSDGPTGGSVYRGFSSPAPSY